MAKNYKVHIRTGNAESIKVIDVQQHAGDKGQPVRIKAQAGAKYVLEEIGRDKAPAPDRVLARRHGKHLEIIFEDGSQPDLIIEDYYGEMPAGYNGLIGQAENGSFYEYIPEDPTREGFVPDLVDGTSPSHLALGGDEVSATGAAVGVFAISPLWGALGLVGAAGGGGGGGGTKVVPTALSVDAVTADNTLNATEVAGDIAITGKVSGSFAAGDKVTLTVNGKSFIGQVLVDGSYSINVPAADLAGDADHRIEATITGTGGTQASAVRSYVLDIVPTQTVTITAVIDNEGSVTGTVANGGTTDDDYLNLNGTLSAALAAGEVVQVYDGNTYLGNAIVTGTTWTFADSRTLANGAHPSYTAKVVGLLGNTGVASAAYTVTINTLVPTIAIESIAADAVNDSTALSGTLDGRERANVLANPTTGHVLVSGTCLNLDGQTITVTVNNHNYTATVATGGAWSVQVPDADALALNHGNSYGVFASGSTTGGKTATDTNNSLRVNIATPDIPTVVNKHSGTTTPTLTGSAMKEVPGTPSTYIALQTGDTLSVTVNGVTVSGVIGSLPPGLSYDDTTNTWSLDTATAGAFALTNGQTYDVGVTVTAGAVTETDISSGELLINTTPPTITLNALSGDGYLNASEATQSLTITGTTTAQVASTVTLTGLDGTTRTATVVAGTGGGSNTFSIDISAANVRNFANVNATKTVNASVVNQYGLSGSDAEDLVIDITAPVAVADTASTTEDTAGSLAGSVAGNDTGLQGGESFVLTNSVGTYGNLSLTSTGAYSYTVTDSAGLQALATDATETFSYQVTDAAGNHSTATLTVNISAVNDEPTGADKALTLIEEGSITLAVADFGFADVDGHSLTGVKITTLPTGGTLALSGTAVTANQVISTADIAAGHLVYTPVLGGFGANYANLQFKVQDSGVTHNEAISPNTITLNVTQLTRIALDPVTADNTINAAESAGNITVTGTVSGAYAVGDQVTLHVNHSTVSVGVLADGSFSFTVPASSLVADADLTIEATISGTNGTSAQAQKTYAVDTAPPANVTVSLDAITGDDYLVTGETDTGVTHTLTGKVTGEFRAGDAVTLTINGQNYSGTVDSAGRFAVANVLGSDLKNDSDHTVAASFTASDAAGNTATVATTRAYSLSGGNNDGMVTAISLQAVTGDNILDRLDAANVQTAITGKVTGVFAAGDVVTLSLNNTTATGAVAADGTFSINVNTADLSADADLQIEARVTGTGGDTTTASQHYALGSSGVTVIGLNPVTSDNIVNIAEALITVPVTGKVSGTFATTDTITLVVNGVSYTGQPASDGSFSINVSGAELVVDTDSRITASITGTGGSAATAAQDYGVILIGPSTSVAIDAISQDSGVSDSDFITNDSDGLTLTATLSNPLDVGERLWYSKDNGATWTDISASVSGTAVSHFDAALTSSTTVRLQVRDAAGNVGGSDSKNIVIDTSGDNTQSDNQPDPNANAAVVSIDAITEDTGTSASDFVTKDNNGLTYSGSVTQFTANGAAIHLVLTNSAGTTLASTYVVPTMGSASATSGSWNWTPAVAGGIQADGQYTLSATVVDAAGNAITGATNDSQLIVIDSSGAHKDDGTDDVNKSATIRIGSVDDASASTTAANGSKDSGVSSSDFVTNDNTLTFTGSVAGFSNTEGGKVHLVVTRAGTAVVDQYLDPDSAGTWIYSNQASTLADGSYTITATIVDRAGNTVVAATPQTLVIDTSTTQKDDGSNDDNSGAAVAVAITSIHNASSSIDSGVSSSDFVTTDPTLVISGTTSNFTANGDLVHVRLYDQAGTTLLAQTWLTPTANTWSWDRTASSLTDGTYQIRADIVDVAGNTVKAGSPQTLVIDNAVPTTTVAISAISLDTGDNTADFITNDNNGLTVSGTLSAALVNGQVLEYSNDNGSSWTHITSSVSGVNVSYFDSALTSTATVQMRVVSQSGVAGAAVSQLVTIDAQAPAQTVVITDVLDDEGAVTGTVAHGGVTDDTSLNLKGTLSAALGVGEVLKVYDGSTYLGNASVSGTGWTFVDARTLSNNQSLSYSAKVEDVAGNTSAASNSYAVSINNSVPTITIGSISGDAVNDTTALNGTYDATERGSSATTVSTRPVISGTATALDGQTLSVTVNGNHYSALVSGGSWSVELSNSDAVALNHGSTYSVSVSGTTTGGKTATDTNNSLFINTALPDVPTVVTNHSGTLTPTLTGQVQKEDPSHPGTYIALEAGDILSVTVNGVTVTGTIGNLPAGLSYNASTSSWSLATDSSHGLASGNTYNVAVTATSGISVANPSGVSKSDISSGELVIDTTAPALTLNAVSGDGYMNATEAGQSLTLTGSTTAQVGSVVTLTGLDGRTRTTTVVAGNTFALTLSASEVAAFAGANATKTVTASVVNLYGLSASDSKPLVIDITAPVAVADTASANEDITSLTGSVASNDTSLQGGESYSLQGTATGTYGSISLGSNGSWTYTVSNSAALNALQANATERFSYTVTDAAGNSSTASLTVTLTPVNDAPVNTVASASQSTDEDSAKVITGLSVADVDAASSAITVTLSVLHGTLNAVATTGVTIGNNGTASVTLSGSVADINDLLANANGLTYTPSANYFGSDTLTMLTDDGGNTGSGGALTDSDNLAITVTPVNDAPVVDAHSTNTAYTENGSALAANSAITLSDVDSATLTGATVTIGTGYTAGDTLAFTAGNGISGSYSNGVLTLSGTATVAQYQAALRSITYVSSSDDPTATSATRTLSWQVDDGESANHASNVGTSTITLTPVNDAPVVNAQGTVTAYTENDAATVANSAITLSDADSANLTRATVTISSGYTAGDALAFTAANGISGSWDSASGVLTLTGSATVVQYQAALRSVTFVSSSDNPTAATRTLSWLVDDGQSDNHASSVVTSTITVTPVNDAPVVDVYGPATSYTENGAAIIANGLLALSDVDNTTLAGAAVRIGAGFTAGDALAFTPIGNITGSYNSTTGVLTLTGTDSLANYEIALQSVTYASSSDNPTASSATRTLNWQVDDGQGANHASNVATSTVNITAVNDAPVVDAHGTNTAYTENGAALAANSAITLSDADSATLTAATVTISGGLTTGDVLAFVDANGITGSYNSATGVLTLNGTATVAQYQAALQSVTYASTSDNPTASSATRTLSWQVDDGQGANHASNVATSTITVTPVNDAPVVDAQSTNTAYTENEAAKVANSAITLSDVDSTTLSGATVTISSGRTTGDVLGFTAANGISGNYNSSSGVLTLSGTATVAQYQAALQSVTYFSSSDAPTATSATRTLSWQVDDGQGANHASNVGTSTIAITAVDDAPTGTNATLTAVEDTDLALTSANFGFSDVDGHTLTGVTITTLPAVGSLQFNGVAVTVNQFISKADIDAGLLKFRSALDGNGTAYDTLQFKVHDSGATNNEALSANTLTFNVTAVNDNPALRTMITATNEDSVYTVKVSDLIAGKFSDPDVGDSAKGITIQWINGLPSGTTFNMEWSADGSTNWTAFPTSILQGTNTPGSALFLLQTATIRYTAAANYAGNVDVFVRVADSTMPSTVHDTTLNANVPLANGVRLYVWDYASSSGDTTKPLSNSAAIWTLITSPINDAPLLVTAGTVATVNEDASNNTAVSLWSTTPVYGPGGGSDEASQTPTYTITAVPSFISLYKSNGTTPVTANTTLTAAEFASLTYKTVANANGTGNVSFYVTDSGTGTAPNVNVLSNQSVSVTVNAVNDAPVGVNDTATALEAGGVANGTAGTNPAGNVITNDTDVDNATNTLTVKDVKAGSGSVTAVTAGTTSANGLSLAGSYGTLVIGADGSYTYTVDNANATVQALNTGSTALSDVFTYTVKDPSGATSTATLTVAVNGANDAPAVANLIADTTGTTGTAFSYTVAANAFTDVDSTLSYTATLADGSALPSWLSFNASTRTFSGTPTTAGTVSVKVTASDGSLSANDTYDIVISTANHAPTVTQTSATADPLGAATTTYSSFTAGSTLNPDGTAITGNGTYTFGGTTATVSGNVGSLTNSTSLPYSGGTHTGLWLGDGSVDETATVTFSKAVSQVKVAFNNLDAEHVYYNYDEKLVIYINGQHYPVTPSMVRVDNSAYAAPIDSNGDLTGVVNTLTKYVVTITIDAVPGTSGITSVAVMNDIVSGNTLGSIVAISATENTSTGTTATPSATVQTLFGSYYADSDSGDLMRGVMVSSTGGSTAQTSLGKYQYSHDGGTTWVDISAASVSESSALYLAKTDLVRFVPSASNLTGAKPDLVVHVVDSFSGSPTYTVGTSYDTTGANSGGSTSISGGTFTLKTTGLNPTPVTLTDAINGQAVNDNSGLNLSNVGDVNGDGIDDLLIGAHIADPASGTDAGKAYVVFGTTGNINGINLSAVAGGTGGFVINGGSASNYLGNAVSGLGDINGDGLADILVGAYNATVGGLANAGASYVIYGKNTTTAVEVSNLGTNGYAINGQAATDYSGDKVSAAGDVNGDGIADFIVGAYRADATAGADAGKAYVVFGNATNTSTISLANVAGSAGGFVINGQSASDYAGVSVSAAGDVNGDGYADLLVGANQSDPTGGANAGRTYVVFGKASTTAVDLSAVAASSGGFVINGQSAGEESGYRVAGGGDINGDGYADLIIGAYKSDPASGTDAGRTYVVFGKASTTAVDLATIASGAGGGYVINGESASDGSAYKISTAGDLNGDGLSDVIIGAYSPNSGAGRAYVVYGKTDRSAIDLSAIAAGSGGFAINGQCANDSLASVTAAGDLNGDGFDDLAVSAYYGDPAALVANSNAGKTYIVYGGPKNISGNLAWGTGTSADEFVVGTAGDDTLVGNGGVDRFSAGAGKDTIVLSVSDVTNLASNTIIASGQARVDGSTGFDTIRLTGGANLDLGAISNVGAMTGTSGLNNSRINDIERVDMGTDTGVNTLTLTAKDVNDMSPLMNQIHLGGSTSTNPDGRVWTNVSGTALSATTQFHQIVVDGTSADKLVLSPDAGVWGLKGVVSNGTTQYNVYQNSATKSQVIVAQGVVVDNQDPFSDVTFTGTFETTLVGTSTYVFAETNSNATNSNAGINAPNSGDTDKEFQVYNGANTGAYYHIDSTQVVAGTKVSNFTASYKVFESTPTLGDGISFSFGASSSLNANEENGYNKGLALRYIHTSGTGAAAFGLYWNTTFVGNTSSTYAYGSTYNVGLAVTSTGAVTVSVNGTAAFSGTLAQWTTADMTGWKYGIGGRTGANTGLGWVDDLVISDSRALTPVVLDLNRDGTFSYTHTLMDVTGDGRLDYTAWAGPQDGVLVWNKFGDGLVHDASQYAFAQYGGGTDLAGLAAGFDSNHDGVLDSSDAKFAEFGAWQDANGNGVVDAGEFKSLSELGVASLRLSSDATSRTPAEGVTETGHTAATMADGSSMAVADAAFDYRNATAEEQASHALAQGETVFKLSMGQVLDLSAVTGANALTEVDASADAAANTIRLTLADLLVAPEQAHTLKLTGDSNDTVVLDLSEWTRSDTTVTENGHTYAVYNAHAMMAEQLLIDQHMLATQNG